MIPGGMKLDVCVGELSLEQVVDIVAAARLAEEMRDYANSHDSPATGRTPSCFIRLKFEDGFYRVVDSAQGLVYICTSISVVFNKKYRMQRNLVLGTMYDECVRNLGYSKTVELMHRYRSDFDSGPKSFDELVDDAYEAMYNYIFGLTDSMTLGELLRKNLGFLVS